MSTLEEIGLDHLGLHVTDIRASMRRCERGLGLAPRAAGRDRAARHVVVGDGAVPLLLSSPRVEDDPVSAYLEAHGDGVGDIALRVPDAAAAFALATARGARPLRAPSARGDLVTARIAAFGDVTHTLVQRAGEDDRTRWPGLRPVAGSTVDHGLRGVDHLAVCLEPGTLDGTVDFYRSVLDFETVFTEHIVVGRQAMNSTVVRTRSGEVTLTLIEPDTARRPGQIDRFLKDHGGPGVQHVAFASDDILASIAGMAGGGVSFLSTPEAYYRRLERRVRPTGHTIADLAAANVLVDEDDHGQMYQIFTRSEHPRGTLFFEVIERRAARTFGSNNITALYEAVEYGAPTG